MAILDVNFMIKSWNNWEVGAIDSPPSEIMQSKKEKARRKKKTIEEDS